MRDFTIHKLIVTPVLLPIVFLISFLMMASNAWSGGEGNHSHDGASAEITISPRVESRFDNFQVVLVYANRRQYEDNSSQFFGNKQVEKFADPRVVVFLENFLTGEPGTGAKLEASINFIPEPLNEIAPGVYVSNNIILGGGRNEIDLNYDIAGNEGTVSMILMVPGGETSLASVATIVAPPVDIPDWVFLLVIVAIYLTMTGVFYALNRPAHQSSNNSPATKSPREPMTTETAKLS